MGKTQPKVLIVILNYGTFEMTINLIKQLQADLEYENYSIMVVDNCSPNESAEVLEEKSHELNYIFYANKTNAGYAAGNNIGIRYGINHGFDYTWILNNDVELREKNVLNHMVEIAESGKTADFRFIPCRTCSPRMVRATNSCTRKKIFKRMENPLK